MKSIEVAVLNPEVIPSAEKMMVCAARLTQRGHKIKSLDDFMALYNKSYTEDTVTTMTKLPHPTIQKFGAINVVIVGASRRFLAQITRHQNEVKFMSTSLQYSDYSDDAAFAIPYEVMERGEEETYLTSCKLNSYLADIDRQAEEIFSRLVKQLAEKENVTESLKATDQMAWVQKMNNIHNAAMEVVSNDLIYA